jgi:hypothetical protein
MLQALFLERCESVDSGILRFIFGDAQPFSPTFHHFLPQTTEEIGAFLQVNYELSQFFGYESRKSVEVLCKSTPDCV